ncbi:hypothetical protein HU200_043587 [Digitaria exilis]|uniref:Uncharacterized protein n=1 Tax=Digitaria exilis TaxID=1010633 RepID=A0A835B0B6_9POAL|nr:hypothetical protein HU200_043587 [Digitaria exilis]
MMLPLWNNFLHPQLYFIVRSTRDERLGRAYVDQSGVGLSRLGSIYFLHRWQKKKEEESKEEDFARSNLQRCWLPFSLLLSLLAERMHVRLSI